MTGWEILNPATANGAPVMIAGIALVAVRWACLRWERRRDRREASAKKDDV